MMRTEDLIDGLEMHPTRQVIWNTPEHEEEWGPILRKGQALHQELEYQMVLQGKRKCGTIHLTPTNFDKRIERLTEDGLVWLPLQRNKNYSGFSHRHFPVEKLGLNSTVYGVFARSLKDARAFRRASKGPKTDHKVLGELLGFPECCSQAFIDWWPDYYDPVYQCALGNAKSEGRTIRVDNLHVATNQMVRYAGFRLTSHFPCRLDCEGSIQAGQEWHDLGMEYDRAGMEALEKVLTLPGRWSVLHSIATVVTEPFTIIGNSMPTKQEWAVEWEEVGRYG